MEEHNKVRIWKSLRISFAILIGLWILFVILEIVNPENNNLILTLLAIVWYLSIVFVFILSIIHIAIFDKRGFAITTLIISFIFIIANLIMFTIEFSNFQ